MTSPLLDVFQFGRKSYNNEGAYATLKPPDFETPSFHTFKAADKPKVYASMFSSLKEQLEFDYIRQKR